MGDRSRSRSREPKDVASAAKAGEQEIVAVAIKQLPADIRERLEKLFEEGLLKEGDLDLRAITVFASLNENLQSRVLNHMGSKLPVVGDETERIYVANARSKSGFLIATCDKAKTGCLDARGLGAIDPWRTALVAMATPKQKLVELKSEQDWLDEKGDSPIKINVDVSVVEGELGMSNVTVELPLTETCAAVKAKLVAMGVRSIPANRMKLYSEPAGYLKERFTFAFYNLGDGATLSLTQRKRAGSKFRRDHTVMPKRPKAPPSEKKPESAPAAAQSQPSMGAPAAAGAGAPAAPAKAAGVPGMPGMPAGMPALPELPKLPSLPGMPTMGVPKLPGMPGMGTAPGLPGMPGLGPLPALPGLAVPGVPGAAGKAPGLPGMPQMPGGYPKMPGMPGMPGMAPPGMGGMPGMPGMMAGAAAKGGMPMGGPGGAMPKGM